MKRLVLDLETKRSFDEVGGPHNKTKLGVSVVGVYHYDGDRFICYREEAFGELEHALKEADEIVGFNLVGFDWPVLAAELGEWVYDLPTVDLMLEAQKVMKRRTSLNAFAKATLGASKLGSGLDALEFYRAGDWAGLERYCLEDVKLTRDLYEYAKKNGKLLFQKGDRSGAVKMSFTESPFAALFREAAKNKSSIKISYGDQERLVDVHSFDGSHIRGYCHLRQERRTFRIDKVDAAERVASSHPLF